jgi:hypothetical protein
VQKPLGHYTCGELGFYYPSYGNETPSRGTKAAVIGRAARFKRQCSLTPLRCITLYGLSHSFPDPLRLSWLPLLHPTMTFFFFGW